MLLKLVMYRCALISNHNYYKVIINNQWKQDKNVNTLPRSPDINIIENVWKILKHRVQRRTNEIRNAGDLERVVRDIWSDLPLDYILIAFIIVYQGEFAVCYVPEVILQSTNSIRLLIHIRCLEYFRRYCK